MQTCMWMIDLYVNHRSCQTTLRNTYIALKNGDGFNLARDDVSRQPSPKPAAYYYTCGAESEGEFFSGKKAVVRNYRIYKQGNLFYLLDARQ